MGLDYQKLLQSWKNGAKPQKNEILACLMEEDPNIWQGIFQTAHDLKEQYHGRQVLLRAIVEISNYCHCNCSYCGLSFANKSLTRYRMTEEEILTAAQEVAEAGYRTIILQSGEDAYYTKELIGEIVKEISSKYEMAITLSLGERSRQEYAYWRDCGAERYLIKHETSSEQLYNALHPHSSLKRRLECQKDLRELGYVLGGGFMVGLPGQNLQILADDICLLAEMSVGMAGIGPYISHPKTALAGSLDGSPLLTLKALALTRLLLPKVNLPSTTALNVKGNYQSALYCGANVMMQKANPSYLQKLYEIYPMEYAEDRPLSEKRAILLNDLQKAGFSGL
ncbi:MAG: [FeFe] hydrogenase H-cluster radical SAM maturase HydE [Clostridiales bacterium]